MQKGSVSVFFSFILVSVMCLIFTMGECIRVYELNSFAQEYSNMAVESAFSEFNPYLWKNYRILAIDLGYGTEVSGPDMMAQKTLDYCRYNSDLKTGLNFAIPIPETCVAKSYSMLTDKNGVPVVELGVKAAKQGMTSQIVDGIQDNINSLNEIEEVKVEEKVKSGKSTLENAKAEQDQRRREAEEDGDPNTKPEDYPGPGHIDDNPLDFFEIMKDALSKGMLSTVTDAEKLSDCNVDLEKLPSHRTLTKGNIDIEKGKSIVDKTLFIDYLVSNYSHFGNDKKHGGLKYELEYLVTGKESDVQCLESVVEQILLVREGANYMTIVKSPAMMGQAKAVAEILAGFTGNPVLIEAVKYAVIGAWAYAESVLDLRLLLSGGKVVPVKNVDQWTSDIWNLSTVCNVKTKAKDCGIGTDYKSYLIAFLATRGSEKLAMRALDIMENALNSTDDYKNTKVDNMLWAADMEITYSAEELFLSLLSEKSSKKEEISQYYFTKTKYLSY